MSGDTVDAVAMLERLLIDGMKPNSWMLAELGLETKYLERMVDKVKRQLWMLPDYRPLRDAIDSDKQDGVRANPVAEASYADVRCLRIARKWESLDPTRRYNYRPLLSLHITADDRSRYAPLKGIELFLTCNGEWIHYHGSDLTDNDSFTVCKTVEELSAYLDKLDGDDRRLSPPKHTVPTVIANWLIDTLREDVKRRKRDVELLEEKVTECEVLRERMNLQ